MLASLATVDPSAFVALDDPEAAELKHVARSSSTEQPQHLPLNAPRAPEKYRFVRYELPPLSSATDRELLVRARLKQFSKELVPQVRLSSNMNIDKL